MEQARVQWVVDELTRVRDDLARDGRTDLAGRIDAVRAQLLRERDRRYGEPSADLDLYDAIMLALAIIGMWK